MFFDRAAAWRLPVRLLYADLLNSRVLRQAVADAEVVYHLAARVHTPFAHEDPHGYAQVNHWGAAELSYALVAHPVRRVIYLSSASVYGATQTPADPETPPRPETHYGMTKLQGERMLQRLEERMPVLIVRAGNLFGYASSMRIDAVVNKWMFEALHRGVIRLEGGGEQLRSFAEVGRSAALLARLAVTDWPSGVLNLIDYVLPMKQLSGHFKTLFPDLDIIETDQDIAMRSLAVAPSEAWETLLGPPPDILNALSSFKEQWQWPQPIQA